MVKRKKTMKKWADMSFEILGLYALQSLWNIYLFLGTKNVCIQHDSQLSIELSNSIGSSNESQFGFKSLFFFGSSVILQPVSMYSGCLRSENGGVLKKINRHTYDKKKHRQQI